MRGGEGVARAPTPKPPAIGRPPPGGFRIRLLPNLIFESTKIPFDFHISDFFVIGYSC